MKRIFPLAALALAAALLLSACGARITGVSLTVPETMERGAAGEAVAEYTFSGEAPAADKAARLAEEQGLRYTSSDPAVVTVDQEGILTAVGAGTAVVTLASEDGELSASGTVTVVVSHASLTMPEALELPLDGEPQSVAATVEPADATDQAVAYTSSDEGVATVDQAGTVTAVAAGEATITARLQGLEAACTVTVTDPAADEAAAESGGEVSGEDGFTLTLPTGYGAVPFSAANGSGTWWGINSTDSAFTATLDGINSYRAAAGVAPLTVADDLTAIADQRCGQLVDTGLTHDGSTTIEIIGQNARTGQDIVAAWANSPDHYNAMVYPSFTQCGIACWFNEYGWTYWCVTFR